jgi:hypothetical protein
LSEYAPLETGLFAIRQVIIGQARRMGRSDVRIESNLSSVPHRGRYRYHSGRAHIARVRETAVLVLCEECREYQKILVKDLYFAA